MSVHEKPIVRGKTRKPMQYPAMDKMEPVIVRGTTRTPGSAFDRRPDTGMPYYHGPSKLESRKTGLKMGYGQSKKHKSTGGGQYSQKGGKKMKSMSGGMEYGSYK